MLLCTSQPSMPYREAFLDAANEAAGWDEPDIEAIDAAWEERRCVKEQAQVERDGIYLYQPGHEVEAPRARGRAHALEFVAQAWERSDVEQRNVRAAIGPWAANVARWAGEESDPLNVSIPPRPDDDWPPEPDPPPRPKPGNLTPFTHRQPPEIPPARPRLPTLTLAQLVDHFPCLREPVIHGLLRQGETMNVISSSKTGKSWLVSDLALAVALGRPWLNAFLCEPGRVLMKRRACGGRSRNISWRFASTNVRRSSHPISRIEMIVASGRSTAVPAWPRPRPA